MSNYGVFAQFYDSLTQNAEYKVRSDYISDFFQCENKKDYKVLDIACGTGTVAKELENKGCCVTGLDLSEDMLTQASAKGLTSLIKCDMRSFDFNESFDCCICTLDSINHLETKKDWEECFESVNKSLKENGLFIFDMNTVYKHSEVLGNNTFIFDRDSLYLVWDNELLDKNKVRIILDFFIKEGEKYGRFTEDFIETAFSIDEVSDMLKDKFDILGVYDDLSRNAPESESERVFFVCKRK